ncbi:MAG TPA: hypothetical protein VI215_00075 [Bacteroidota bacterium]
MKTSAFLALLLSLLISLTEGCSPDSPTEAAVPFDPGTWSGDFTYKANYGSEGSVTQTGVVTFKFSASEYSYEATVTSLVNRTTTRYWAPGTLLRDRGNFTKFDQKANMVDFSSLRTTDVPQRSLYFHGTYSYSAFGNSLSFSKSEDGASLTVTISKQE